MLQFKGNQFLLMKNYRQKLKQIKTPYFRFYSGLLLAYYTAQVVLHFTATTGYIFDDPLPMAYLNVSYDDERRKFYVIAAYPVLLELHAHLSGTGDRDAVRAILLLHSIG